MVGARDRRMDSFPAGVGALAGGLLEFVVERGVGEVGFEQRLADAGRQPDAIEGERVGAGEPDSLDQHEFGVGR